MSLDVFQQVFRLNLLSNGVAFCKGDRDTLEKKLQDYLIDEIPKTGAGWELAWGPVVWKVDPKNTETGPENAWFIAFHPRLQFEDGTEHPTYVVAIAGTPVESNYVWFFQNFQVYNVTDFVSWVDSGIQNKPESVRRVDIIPGNKYIAKGTVDAVHLLLDTRALAGVASADTTLLEFIATVDLSESSRFIFTGHSLGGALAPSLALALVSAGVLPPDQTLTYPTAGPSPGNIYFAELFTETFPPRKEDDSRTTSYQGWNLNWVNTIDIVPQAWAYDPSISEEQNLKNIPTIYGEPPVRDVESFVQLAIGASYTLSGVLYKPIPSQYFTGPPPAEVPKTRDEFLEVAGPQHLRVYADEIGVSVKTLCEDE